MTLWNLQKNQNDKGDAVSGYFQKEVEILPREKLEALQFSRIKNLLEAIYAKNPFYRKKFMDKGAGPE